MGVLLILPINQIENDEIHTYYEAADIFILPTVSLEGFGLATIEALSSGLPVLGTPVGGTVEILKDIDSKLLFDGTSPKVMASGIEDFLINPDLYSSLNMICRKKAANEYSWDQVVDRLEGVFYDTVGRTINQV